MRAARWPAAASSSATASVSRSPAGPACSPGSPTSPTSRGTPRSPCPRSPAAGSRCPAARATRRLTARYGPAEGVQVELRGAGQASRQVNNFCTPATFDADKMIAVEVLTPAANWSSFPPHKHDEQRDGRGPARGGLLLRGRPGRARLPARLHLRPGPGDRRLRRGAHRRHRAGPARLARPVDGHPRLPPLLPERDGRPQPGPDLADLRRPGTRLGAGHLGGARRSTRGCR